MKILVAVKQVASLDGEVVLDGAAAVAPEALRWRLNESDELALQAALELAEASADVEVIAVSVGERANKDGLRTCLARGAARAIGVWDRLLAGADPLAVAKVLAAVAGAEAPDLILCGVQSSDAANAATGAALAGLLDLAHVVAVSAIECDGETLTVQRELEGGGVEVLRLRMPALLTVQSTAGRPRAANLRAIKLAREQPLATPTLAALGLDGDRLGAVAGSRTLRLLKPERDGGARMIEGSPAQIARGIAEIVRAELAV